jgi:hypothetical protein
MKELRKNEISDLLIHLYESQACNEICYCSRWNRSLNPTFCCFFINFKLAMNAQLLLRHQISYEFDFKPFFNY